MKQRLILFSALLIVSLLLGVASATQDNLSVNITYSGTGSFRPGDEVNITANFNQSVSNATISITNDPLVVAGNANLVGASLVTDDYMTPLGDNAFGYNFVIPEEIINGPLDIAISALDSNETPLGLGPFSDADAIELDPSFDFGAPVFKQIKPESEFVNKSCVLFNFSVSDDKSEKITYVFYINDIAKDSGTIASGSYKQLELELADGQYKWEVRLKDDAGNTATSGIKTLYVDTNCPTVKLVSPQDCYAEIIGKTKFNFTCEDALAAQYNLDLPYTLYIDGVAKASGNTKSGASVIKELALDDGAHNWSVSVKDGAGHEDTSEVRKFYVSLDGFKVSLVSPREGYAPANPTLNFTVTGMNGEGAGLPFHYKLIINNNETDATCNQNETHTVCCAEGTCCADGLVIGKDIYSISTTIDGEKQVSWTVNITDCSSGRTYQPAPFTFMVDSKAPAPVANLCVVDAMGDDSIWDYPYDYPGLKVSWNASTETDLASTPYEVYISTAKPNCIEDMKRVVVDGSATHSNGDLSVNQILKGNDTDLCIEALEGKDLVYGKDYWVAVIARDNASNYDKCFAMCGPVQTYEDMNITLEKGWNLKSVPKRLVESNACASVFGENSTVIYWDGSCWQFPQSLEPCKGYWVYTEEPRKANAKFKPMSDDSTNPDVPASLELTPGWHMIGHTTTYPVEWPVTLASLNDASVLAGLPDFRFSNLITYSQNEGWGGIISDMYDGVAGGEYVYSETPMPVGALQSDDCMVPGQGYWIFMKEEGTYASIENVNNNTFFPI